MREKFRGRVLPVEGVAQQVVNAIKNTVTNATGFRIEPRAQGDSANRPRSGGV